MNKTLALRIIAITSVLTVTIWITHYLTRAYDLTWVPVVFACGFLYGERAIIIDNDLSIQPPENIKECLNFKNLAQTHGFIARFPETPPDQ